MLERTFVLVIKIYVAILLGVATFGGTSVASADEITPHFCQDMSVDTPRFIITGLGEYSDGWWIVFLGSEDGSISGGGNWEGDHWVVDYGVLIEGDDGTQWTSTGAEPCIDEGADPPDAVQFITGNPEACYFGYLEPGHYLLTDASHPDGIIWRADQSGRFDLIVSDGSSGYSVTETSCPA